MSKEISENTSITISIKTIVTVTVVLCSAFGFYYKLMGEIEEAKLLPKTGNGVYAVDPKTTWPPSRNEYKMKDDLQVNKRIFFENGKEYKRLEADFFELKTTKEELQKIIDDRLMINQEK
jgi:hypothetical protein